MGIDPAILDAFFANETLGSPESAVGFVLWKLVHRFQRAIDRELQVLDLTHLQFTTLAMAAWLNRSHGAATQAQISRYADIQPMQISQILTVLERKGMVQRAASVANARAKSVEITRAGLSTLRRAMPIAIDVQRRLFGKHCAPGGPLLAALQSIEAAQGRRLEKTGRGRARRSSVIGRRSVKP